MFRLSCSTISRLQAIKHLYKNKRKIRLFLDRFRAPEKWDRFSGKCTEKQGTHELTFSDFHGTGLQSSREKGAKLTGKADYRMVLHAFVPAYYCQHLTPIKRLWGPMHKGVTHNKTYAGVDNFCNADSGFLLKEIPKNWHK